MRIISAMVASAAVMCGMACPYYVIHHNIPRAVLMAMLAIGAVVIARRLVAERPEISLVETLIGSIAGFAAAAFALPYRTTSAAWGMTPETLPSQVVFLALYFAVAVLGGVGGGFIPFRRLVRPGR